MTVVLDNYVFHDGCEEIDVRSCAVHLGHIYPCSCERYLQCGNGFTLYNRTCSQGTAWDNLTQNCLHQGEIYAKGLCNERRPWTRCNVSDTRLEELRILCGGALIEPTTDSPIDSTFETTNGTNALDLQTERSGSNIGLAIGLAVGCTMLVLVGGLLLFCFKKKRRNQSKPESKNGSKSQKGDPDYQNMDDDDEIYSVIDDNMCDPVYIVPQGRPLPPVRNSSSSVTSMTPILERQASNMTYSTEIPVFDPDIRDYQNTYNVLDSSSRMYTQYDNLHVNLEYEEPVHVHVIKGPDG